MKTLVTILVIAVLTSTVAYAGENKHEMFDQICALLELDGGERQKLAVAFVTLEENLVIATAGVGDENVDPQDMIDEFNATRSKFRESVGSFLDAEQLETMAQYSSAIFYKLTENIARIRVKQFEDSLELTDDQMTALTLVVDEDMRSVVETFLLHDESDEFDPDAMIKSLSEIRENTQADIKRILTGDQWTKLQKMRG